MSPFEEVLCLPALWLSCMHPRARLNWDCIIGKAPPFLLWLTSGDVDLPKSVLAVTEEEGAPKFREDRRAPETDNVQTRQQTQQLHRPGRHFDDWLAERVDRLFSGRGHN